QRDRDRRRSSSGYIPLEISRPVFGAVAWLVPSCVLRRPANVSRLVLFLFITGRAPACLAGDKYERPRNGDAAHDPRRNISILERRRSCLQPRRLLDGLPRSLAALL